MGGGMGHLAHLGTLMRALLVHGCRPVGVFRELHHVHHLIPPCEILAAPVGNAPQAIAPTFVYPQLLFNSGFHRYEELRTRIRSWQTILALTKPDLLICEHSPTALLAAHCLGVPACTFGTGFLAPPDVWPPVELIPGGAAESLQWAEDYVRELVNRILAEFGRPPLARVNELYGRVSRNFLVTFEELDHFAERRPASRYFGAWSHMGGAIPEWRGGDGPRIYAYLKPCPLLPALIGYLSRLPNPLLIYAPEVHNDALQRLVRSNVAIASQPVDMAQAAEQCDVALLNATHGTTSAMFLAGKPCFHVPIYLEQAILANRLMSRGAAMGIEQTQTAELLESRLSAFLATNTCAAIAANLADRYRNFDLQQEVTAVAEEIHQMAV
jgi:hypothetical protein